MYLDYKKVLVIDLEATCWETKADSDQNTSEIIEIGVCLLDTSDSTITKKRSIYVKPEVSTVSDFCEKLTGIKQSLLDAEGVSIVEAFDILKKEYKSKNYVMSCFGNYDFNKINKTALAKNINSPLSGIFINASALASLKSHDKKKMSMAKAMNEFGLEFEGRQHSGADDAYNTAVLLRHLL